MPVIESKQIVNGEEVSIYIEVDEPPVPVESSGYQNLRDFPTTERIIEAARDVLGDGVKLIQDCAARVVSGIKNMDKALRPEEIQVQLAIKLDSELGAVLAKAKAGAHMQVTMKWNTKET